MFGSESHVGKDHLEVIEVILITNWNVSSIQTHLSVTPSEIISHFKILESQTTSNVTKFISSHNNIYDNN